MPDDIYTLAQQLAQAAARKDAVALKQLTDAYLRMYRRLSVQIEALAQQVGDGQMSTGQLARMGRYISLREQVEGELGDYAAYTRVELSRSAEDAITRALADSRSLMSAGVSGAGVNVAFTTLPSSAVMKLLGFLQPTSPLFLRLQQLAPVNAKAIADLFVECVGLGLNPREIARRIRSQFGMALTDALRMTRTAQLYAYREATRANYIANSDVIEGWYWMAAIGQPNTCMSCIRMHGTFHQLSERLNDHHNGRCAMLPGIKGMGNPIKQSGLDWFEAQPSDTQRQYLGRDYYNAWKEGKYSLEDISTENDNDVYGMMRSVTPLHVLLGVT